MLKWLAILAALLTVAHASAPPTEQVPNYDRGESYADRRNAGPNQTKPADPGVIPQSPAASAPQGESDPTHEIKNQRPVSVAAAPFVPSKRDWVDYSSLGTGIFIALITFFGVLAAWRGLPEFKRQAEAARDAAKAVLDSERAWLTAQVLNFEEPPPQRNMIWIEVAITNRGKTPARIHSIVATTKLVPTPNSLADAMPGKLPPSPDYSDTSRVIELRGYDIIVAPEDTFRHIHVYIWPGEWSRITARELSLYVYGTIEYSDTVKGAGHTTSFCSIYAVPLPNFGEPTGFMFSQYIPDTYFRAT